MPSDLQTILYGNTAAAATNGNGTAVTSPGATSGAGSANPNQDSNSALLDAITQRLTQQGKGISSSSSSNLQASINDAITSTQKSGDSSSAALQLERQREVGAAQTDASNTITGTMEGQSGYATQVAGLKALTETTEKSVRDLDQRYQQAILQNDSATASKIADLKMQKLQFQQTQEQNFYTNLFSLGSLKQEALKTQQSNEQFWVKKQQDDMQFVANLYMSKYQFDKNYAMQINDYGIKQQQLEIQREQNKISWADYALKKQQYAKDTSLLNTQALITQDIKNKFVAGKGNVTMDQFLTPEYLGMVKTQTGYTGNTEDLATAIKNSFETVKGDTKFISDATSVNTTNTNNNVGGIFGSGGVAGSDSNIAIGATTAGSLISEGLFGVTPGQQSTASQVDWGKLLKTLSGKAAFGVFN